LRLANHAHAAEQATGGGGNLHRGLGGAGQPEQGGGSDDDLPEHRAFSLLFHSPAAPETGYWSPMLTADAGKFQG
jgi:hypothetical protein